MKKQFIGDENPPLICTPLVAPTIGDIFDELKDILPQKPDIIEWRADFFSEIALAGRVVEVAQILKAQSGNIPFIFTIRSPREGGQPISLDEEEIMQLLAAICTETEIEYVDCELSNQFGHIEQLREVAHRHGVRIIASFHDFTGTPSLEVLREKFRLAESYGLDVAKVAVMPKTAADVLTLLSATLQAKSEIHIPLIAISMGELGTISRIAGGFFGSALTFAVGQHSSAPGQIPIQELRTILSIMQKNTTA